jgi:hypothetical protein
MQNKRIIIIVQYIVRLFCIGIHSVSSWDSVISIFIVQLFTTRLLPLIVSIVHYSDTGNVFQVFPSCKK